MAKKKTVVVDTFEDDFKEFMDERIEKAYTAFINSGSKRFKQYEAEGKEYDRLRDEIYKRTGSTKEAFKLFDELEIMAGVQEGAMLNVAYIQGLQDGLKLGEINRGAASILKGLSRKDKPKAGVAAI